MVASGFGLQGMTERVDALGGSLRCGDSWVEVVVDAELPLARDLHPPRPTPPGGIADSPSNPSVPMSDDRFAALGAPILPATS